MTTIMHFLSHPSQLFIEQEMFQTKVVDKIKTHILCSGTFSRKTDVYGIMWKNIAQPCRPRTTTRRMRIACWIPKATDTPYTGYVMLIAFPL